MARLLGEPVEQELLESIKREEEYAKLLFKEEPKAVLQEEIRNKPKSVLITEADPLPPAPAPEPPPQPAPAFTPPVANTVQQVVNLLKTAGPPQNVYRDKELEGMRRTIADMMQKISTMSWGGGGTGVVRIWDTDDFDRSSAQNGRYMRWDNGVFSLDEINPYEIVYNTTLVTNNTYVVQDSDYYIGANNQTQSVTIILPAAPPAGRMVIIKDESGRAQINPIKIDGNIDNDPGGAEIRINNGGVQLIYRNGWRIV